MRQWDDSLFSVGVKNVANGVDRCVNNGHIMVYLLTHYSNSSTHNNTNDDSTNTSWFINDSEAVTHHYTSLQSQSTHDTAP